MRQNPPPVNFLHFHLFGRSGICFIVLLLQADIMAASDFVPAPQKFRQEVARIFTKHDGLPPERVQLIEIAESQIPRAFVKGQWYEFRTAWQRNESLSPQNETQFAFADLQGKRVEIPVPWGQVRQLLRFGSTNFVLAGDLFALAAGKLVSIGWERRVLPNQIACSPDGSLYLAANSGLLRQNGKNFESIRAMDAAGRDWTATNVLAVGFDTENRLWFGTKAGVGCSTPEGWKFFEGKDGLPYADFTCFAAGAGGEVWFGTMRGVILYDGKEAVP